MFMKLPNQSRDANILNSYFLQLFDMKKFTTNVSRELRRAYPDRRKLEIECVTAVAFVKHESELLNCPCWIMIINLVAMDMLKARIPPVKAPQPQPVQNGENKAVVAVTNGVALPITKGPPDIRNRPKIPLPRDEEDDPYSMVGGTKNGRGDKPPKLPPRDLNIPKVCMPAMYIFTLIIIMMHKTTIKSWFIASPAHIYPPLVRLKSTTMPSHPRIIFKRIF